MNATTKTMKSHVSSTANPTVLSRKLKIALTTLPVIASNASKTFLESLSRTSTSLLSHFFKDASSFDEDGPEAAGPTPSLQKKPVTVSTSVEVVIERVASIGTIVMICS